VSLERVWGVGVGGVGVLVAVYDPDEYDGIQNVSNETQVVTRLARDELADDQQDQEQQEGYSGYGHQTGVVARLLQSGIDEAYLEDGQEDLTRVLQVVAAGAVFAQVDRDE